MIATAANLAWLATRSRAAVRFRRQLHDPAGTQQAVLRDLLRLNAASEFGRRHGFADIRTPAEFAARVPLATYEDLEPWIDRLRRGEPAVLTTDTVMHLVPTSGSSGARKLIPFTARLQREFDRAIGPWIADLYGRHSSALFGPAYWSISPAVGVAKEDSAVPIGFDDDTNYLGGASRRLVAATMAVPPALRHIRDGETFLLLTLVCLLRRRNLRLISVWHPSFLLLLLDALPRHWDILLGILRNGRLPAALSVPAQVEQGLRLGAESTRVRELERIGPNEPSRFWPKLAVISCWTDVQAALGAAALARRFPRVAIQPKGLLATEAFVTIPFEERHPVAVGSHYYEFIDEAGAIHPVEALARERIYEVVVSTGGGLWRYRLGDRVRVTGFVGRTPSLQFVGRAGDVSDLRGEKLSGEFVARVVKALNLSRLEPARFAMLAPASSGPAAGYALFWEGGVPPPAGEVDRLLAENPHYAWCRQLGQLRPARVFSISAGAEAAYFRRANADGRKLGDIKPAPLVQTTGWDSCFNGKFLE
ncbi:MAG TPA: GH3 auxin-responsive promoter family protein [Lacunisphaera sp.]|nr:GH3 auxin-responsive promoter family protein [Lacunisphaera sp.]